MFHVFFFICNLLSVWSVAFLVFILCWLVCDNKINNTTNWQCYWCVVVLTLLHYIFSPDLYSNLFGPKINASENIPGTPMDTPDIVSEFNKSFNSSTTSIINERRRSSSKLLGLTSDRDPTSVGGIGTGMHSSLSDQPTGGTTQGGQGFGGTSVDKNSSLGKGSLRNLLKLRKASDQSQDTRRSSQQDKEVILSWALTIARDQTSYVCRKWLHEIYHNCCPLSNRNIPHPTIGCGKVEFYY